MFHRDLSNFLEKFKSVLPSDLQTNSTEQVTPYDFTLISFVCEFLFFFFNRYIRTPSFC